MPAHILIASGDRVFTQTLERMLGRSGYYATSVQRGYQIYDVLVRDQPDLVLMDINLPDGKSFELCHMMKSDEQTMLTPIILISRFAVDATTLRRQAIESGADDILTTPIDVHLLESSIRAHLQRKLLTDELERTERIIFTIAITVEAKDAYTEAHLWRLSHYSEQMANVIGLPEEDIRAVRLGGFLHDVGKISVDDAVLRKPGRLTPQEYQHMQRHPAEGARIVANLRCARFVHPIVLSHHERWDGGGYPNGTSAENIPLGARIVSIVDAFDAMTSTRPYRRAMSTQDAVRELRNGRGHQWDPHLIDVFLDLIEKRKLAPYPAEQERQFSRLLD